MRPCPGDGTHSFLQGTQSPPPTPGVVYFSMINMDQFSVLIDTAYRDAAEKLRVGDRDPPFPPGCFPPAMPFVGA